MPCMTQDLVPFVKMLSVARPGKVHFEYSLGFRYGRQIMYYGYREAWSGLVAAAVKCLLKGAAQHPI